MKHKNKKLNKILTCALLTIALPIFAINIYINSSLLTLTKSTSYAQKEVVNSSTPTSTTPTNTPIVSPQVAGVAEINEPEIVVSETSPQNFTNSEPQSEPINEPISIITAQPTQTTMTPLLTIVLTKIVYINISNLGNYQISLRDSETAFSSLLRTGQENGFSIDYKNYGSLGAFVTCINNLCATNQSYWAFYYNGAYSPKGASEVKLSPDDTVTWKLEKY